MDSSKFYEALLSLTPDWSVSRVDTDPSSAEVHVYLSYRSEDAISPETGVRCPIYDYREERQWRHLDTMQYRTYLHARVPRVRTGTGIVTVAVPWADARSHLTWLFEEWAIELLLVTKNQSRTARLLRISFDQIHRLMERAVDRGLSDREQEWSDPSSSLTVLSIDEKSAHYGRQFVTVLSDPVRGRVLEVADGRTAEAARSAIESVLPPPLLTKIQAVSADMAASYTKAVRETLPQAQIVYDKFHLFQYLNKAIDQVRRMEVRSQPELRRTRFLLFKHPDNLTMLERQTFDLLNEIHLKTALAWRIRENFRAMYAHCTSIDEARDYVRKWRDHAMASSLKPIQEVARMFDRHLHGILNYFRHPITNAMAEQLNGKIQQLRVTARGYRNTTNLRIAILFYLGNLNLLPQKTQ